MRDLSNIFKILMIVGVTTVKCQTEEDHMNVALPQSCREVVYPAATNPIDCARVTRKQLGIGNQLELDQDWSTPQDVTKKPANQTIIYDTILKVWIAQPHVGTYVHNPHSNNPMNADGASDFDPDMLPGSCRWDMERSNVLGNEAACMCPATKETCSLNRDKCWWYELPDDIEGLIPSFACLNNAERFYYLLEKLLKKRGKNDFAIKLRYSATPDMGAMASSGVLRKLFMFQMIQKMMSSYRSSHNYNNQYSYNNYYQSNTTQTSYYPQNQYYYNYNSHPYYNQATGGSS